MDALHVRQILMQFSNGLNCPHCQSKIEIPWVDIVSTSENRCTLKVQCKKCNNTFGGQAQMVVKLTNEGKKMNTSSLIQGENNIQTNVSETEVNITHNILELPGCSISALFPKNK